MLDGLLGRSGFYTKCKSLIKQTRTRIDVVRRKRSATQKFLREDISNLLANGLDVNAFGRVEGLIAELILSSCYDFIDHVCEIILKHLPVLQKLRECPEDCREAVASLMFAAARFSDLPELRELRDLFQGRYGSSLEYYVNQKLVENINPKPSSTEKKVQLMQDIASEFSIQWDSRGFEERISNPSASKQNLRQSPGTLNAAEKKAPIPFAQATVHKTVKDELSAMKRGEATYPNNEREVDDRYQMDTRREGIIGRRDVLKHNISTMPEPTTDRFKPPSYREETIQKRENDDTAFRKREPKADIHESLKNNALRAADVSTSYHGNRSESVNPQHKLDKHREQKLDSSPINNGRNFNFPSPVNNEPTEDGLKPNFRNAIPPPYVKPRKSKHKAELGSKQDDLEDTLTFKPASNNAKTKPDLPDEPVRFTEIYYKDGGPAELTPRRRSSSQRRRHSRSSSNHDDKSHREVGNDEERVLRRVSTSRRKHESRKGLQILVDEDERYKKDDEERMIDKLLLHYSKKPSSADGGRPRRKKTINEANDRASKSLNHKAVDGNKKEDDDDDECSLPTTSRSRSLPPQQVSGPEDEPPAQKVFTRASSFQPDTPAKHVHPKLPDYDDFVAKLAALRATKV